MGGRFGGVPLTCRLKLGVILSLATPRVGMGVCRQPANSRER